MEQIESSSSRYRWGIVAVLITSAATFAAAPAQADAPFAVSGSKPASSAMPVAPQTLRDAYLAALKRSEAVGIQQELLIQADEIEHQAKASLFPTITGSATSLHQPSPGGGAASSLFPAWQNTVKISGDQPLFRGLRDFAALRQREALTGAQSYAVLNAARQLFYDTATAFYNVLMLSQDERNYITEIQVNQKRLKDLQGFYRIGRSRATDLLTFESNISSLESNLEATRTQLETAKDVLAFETGWSRDTRIVDTEKLPDVPMDVATYLAKVEERPDVKTAAANYKAFEEDIGIAWGQHLPSADLLGDYYFARPGGLSGVDWDVQLALSVPIFQGGAIQSQVRQAESTARQYQLLLTQARRTAEEEVRTFFDAWAGDLRQADKLVQTADLGKRTYEAQVKDYRNGLVTNLDVLEAITTYQDAERLRDRARFAVRLDTVKLQAASAERPEIAEALPSGAPKP